MRSLMFTSFHLHSQSVFMHTVQTIFLVESDPLQSPSTLQQPVQFSLPALQVTVASNMFLRNEDVRHAALARDILQSILQSSTILDLVQFHQEVLVLAAELLVEQRFCRATVGAVGFAEDDDGIAVDDLLRLCLCGCHGGGAGASEGTEKTAEEGSYGCGVVVLLLRDRKEDDVTVRRFMCA